MNCAEYINFVRKHLIIRLIALKAPKFRKNKQKKQTFWDHLWMFELHKMYRHTYV